MGNEVQQQSYAGGKVVVRPAEVGDALPIFKSLRDADERELVAHGVNPKQTVTASIIQSTQAYCVEYLGEPVFIFGVADSQVPDLGMVWGMGTYKMKLIQRQFIRYCRDWIEPLGRDYKAIGNIVDERNTLHRRWLEWCGFEFGHTITYGPYGLNFINFMMRT